MTGIVSGEVKAQLDVYLKAHEARMLDDRKKRRWKMWGAAAAFLVANAGVLIVVWEDVKDRVAIIAADQALEVLDKKIDDEKTEVDRRLGRFEEDVVNEIDALREQVRVGLTEIGQVKEQALGLVKESERVARELRTDIQKTASDFSVSVGELDDLRGRLGKLQKETTGLEGAGALEKLRSFRALAESLKSGEPAERLTTLSGKVGGLEKSVAVLRMEADRVGSFMKVERGVRTVECDRVVCDTMTCKEKATCKDVHATHEIAVAQEFQDSPGVRLRWSKTGGIVLVAGANGRALSLMSHTSAGGYLGVYGATKKQKAELTFAGTEPVLDIENDLTWFRASTNNAYFAEGTDKLIQLGTDKEGGVLDAWARRARKGSALRLSVGKKSDAGFIQFFDSRTGKELAYVGPGLVKDKLVGGRMTVTNLKNGKERVFAPE